MLVVLVLGMGLVVHLWNRAARERREVLARLERERSIRPGWSPTAELFREVGAPPPPDAPIGLLPPVPPAVATTAPTVAPTSMPTRPVILPAIDALPTPFNRLPLPRDFVPVEPSTAERAVFAVERPAVAVRTELDGLLIAAGIAAAWHEPTVATVSDPRGNGLVTIWPHAGMARDLDGSPLFPTARPDETVVRFSTTRPGA